MCLQHEPSKTEKPSWRYTNLTPAERKRSGCQTTDQDEYHGQQALLGWSPNSFPYSKTGAKQESGLKHAMMA